MNLQVVLRDIVEPALALLPGRMRSRNALVLMLAIGLQESRFEHRKQIRGPARGFWQFEAGGGTLGVLRHKATTEHAEYVLQALRVPPRDHRKLNEELAYNDVLAAAFARLLLWTDPRSIPSTASAAWDYYIRNWRPGKPHRHTWDAFYRQAEQAVNEYLA